MKVFKSVKYTNNESGAAYELIQFKCDTCCHRWFQFSDDDMPCVCPRCGCGTDNQEPKIPASDALRDVPVVWDMTYDNWAKRNDGGDRLIGSMYIGNLCAELFATNPDYPQDDDEQQDRAPVDVYVYGIPGYSTWEDEDSGISSEYDFADDISFTVPYEYEPIEAFKAECEVRFKDAIIQASRDFVTLAKAPLAPWTPTGYKYYAIRLVQDLEHPNAIGDFDICIRAKREPTIPEAEEFLKSDLVQGNTKYHVQDIVSMTRAEAMEEFDFENEAEWPIFGDAEERPVS